MPLSTPQFFTAKRAMSRLVQSRNVRFHPDGPRGPAGNGLRCEQRGEEILTARVAVQWLGRKVVPGFAERFSAPREPPARLTNQPGKQPIRLGRFHDDVGDISSPQHGIKSSHIF